MKNKSLKIILKYNFILILFLLNTYVFYRMFENNNLNVSINVMIILIISKLLTATEYYYVVAITYNLTYSFLISRILDIKSKRTKIILIILVSIVLSLPFLFLGKK